MIDIQKVNKIYRNGRLELQALFDIDFKVEKKSSYLSWGLLVQVNQPFCKF